MDSNRRTGRTTRIADKCIQDLMTTGICHCIDHNDGDCGNEVQVHLNRRLMDIVLKRLNYEHSLPYKKSDPFLNWNEFTIKFPGYK
jgi:hypothetical protein